jgi:AraC-like DNA-binding protein
MSQTWSSDDVPADGRLDYMGQVVADTIAEFEVRPHDEDGLFSRFRAADLGIVRVVAIDSRCDVARTPSLIRRSDPELCKIDLQLRGHSLFEQHGRQTSLGPGEFAFVDLSQPCRLALHSSSQVVVVFPRALLPMDQREIKDLAGVTFPGRHATGSLVSLLVREMVRDLDDYDDASGARVGAAVLDLITATLAARLNREDSMPPETQQRALMLRIHAFIEERLGDAELSPGAIAAAHHISTRYLHRLFEPQGTTVSTWIRTRRLARCRCDLLDSALQLRPVSAIGTRWGFGDPASFTRAFRNEYGMPPGEYRRMTIETKE